MPVDTIHFPMAYAKDDLATEQAFEERVATLYHAANYQTIIVDSEMVIGPALFREVDVWPEPHRAKGLSALRTLMDRRRFKAMKITAKEAVSQGCGHCLGIAEQCHEDVRAIVVPTQCKCSGQCCQLDVLNLDNRLLRLFEQIHQVQTLVIPHGQPYRQYCVSTLPLIIGDSPFIEIHDAQLGRSVMKTVKRESLKLDAAGARVGIKKLRGYISSYINRPSPRREFVWEDKVWNYVNNLTALMDGLKQIVEKRGKMLDVRLLTDIGPVDLYKDALQATAAAYISLDEFALWAKGTWDSDLLRFNLDIRVSVYGQVKMSHPRYIVTNQMALRTAHGLDMAEFRGGNGRMRGEEISQLELEWGKLQGSQMYRSMDLRDNEQVPVASLNEIEWLYHAI